MGVQHIGRMCKIFSNPLSATFVSLSRPILSYFCPICGCRLPTELKWFHYKKV